MPQIKNIGNGEEKPLKAWQKLGEKLMINRDMLFQNELSLRYQSGAQIRYKSGEQSKNFKKCKITEDLSKALLNLIENKTINYDLLKKLTKKENDLFYFVLKSGSVIYHYGYKKELIKLNVDEAKERFKILQGEIIAGNNNDEIGNEIVNHILPLLIEYKVISENDGKEILKEFTE